MADALRGAAIERGVELDVRHVALGVLPHLIIEGKTLVATKAPAIAIALRSGDFKFQPKTKMAQYVGAHLADGGLAVPLSEAHLRTAVAAQKLSAGSPTGLLAWRRDRRPLGELAFVRQILELDRDHVADAAAPAETEAPANPAPASPVPPPHRPSEPAMAEPPPRARHDSGPVAVPSTAVRLGVVDSLRAEPILLPLDDLKTHVAFLGSTGSGKTTAALSVVEQLLERDVSVVLVDRKGDLARYASEAWWTDAAAPEPERARKLALRKRIDVALFTPGNSHGRPLRLPLVPSLAEVKSQEREQLARYAAEGLGAMMGYGKAAAHGHKKSILQCAIELRGDERDITLDLVRETINRPDPDLLNAVGSLQRHFASLSEDLQTLRIQRGSLLSGDGEPLDLAALLPPPGTGRAKLSIINTSALTEVPLLQFWILRNTDPPGSARSEWHVVVRQRARCR